MTLEGLWSVEFMSNVGGVGGGVAIFETGRVFGGDSSYYYLGSAKVNGDRVTADVKITHYGIGPAFTVFGPATELDVRLQGKFTEPTMLLEGFVVGNPNMTISIRLTKRAELP